MKKILAVCFGLCGVSMLLAQEQPDYTTLKAQLKEEILREIDQRDSVVKALSPSPLSKDRFSFSGYGAVNYYKYGTYDTDLDIKDKIDVERLNLYLGYRFNDWISMRSEVEFEHGGTGATMELDILEESGEFEQEIEAGGEVKLEQMYLDFQLRPYFNVRAGRVKLRTNLAQLLDRPTSYFTTHKPEMENEILPLGWYENGVQFYGTFAKHFRYELSVTNGLDATGFSTRNWIKKGHQVRFEMANAETPALSGRIDYLFGKSKHTFVGIGGYINNAAPNRPKSDIDKSAYVTLFTAHLSYDEGPLRFNTAFVFGNLENSDVVTRANRGLSKGLGVKRNVIGKQALGLSAELGYEVLSLTNYTGEQKLYPFVRYDYYDTMHAVEGYVIKQDRWERKAFTTGVNWFIIPQILVKAQYQWRRLGGEHYHLITKLPIGRGAQENTFSLGVAFSF